MGAFDHQIITVKYLYIHNFFVCVEDEFVEHVAIVNAASLSHVRFPVYPCVQTMLLSTKTFQNRLHVVYKEVVDH